MKYLVATLSGFAITLAVFVGGVAFAVTYLSAEPVPIQKPGRDNSVFQLTVLPVDRANQNYERIEARPVQEHPVVATSEDQEPPPEIDGMTTAALPIADELPGTSPDHVAWCKERYRSYQPETNRYTSYSGQSRECISPHLDDNVDAEVESIAYAATGASGSDPASAEILQAEHIASCFARYRSYRPEDNTYQPYGGGPRQQC